MTNKEDTINKSLLLNWLYASEKNLPIVDLGKWLADSTNGKYTIIKCDQNDHKS